MSKKNLGGLFYLGVVGKKWLTFFFLQDAKMNSIKCEMFYTLTKKKKVTGMLFETKKY